MSFDVLAILFIVFSIASSLIAKWQERKRQNERDTRRRSTEFDPPEEADFDEWDVFPESRPAPRAETPAPSARQAVDEEFLPVEGQRDPSSERPMSSAESRRPRTRWNTGASRCGKRCIVQDRQQPSGPSAWHGGAGKQAGPAAGFRYREASSAKP